MQMFRTPPAFLLIISLLLSQASALRAQSVPGASDFQKVTLVDNLQNAVGFDFAPDGRIFILDRGGEVKIYKPSTQSTVSAGQIPTFSGLEDGLIGIAFDPGFATNQHIYLHYSPIAPSVNRVSRFTMSGDSLNLASEVVLLEWPTQRNSCCHAGGDLRFDAAGNLYIATGDNAQHGSYGALDEVVSENSAEKSSANTMDMRGKILRVKPNPDGTYSIPSGNLFPGGSGGLPEIYVMGCRNPYKMFIDPVTNWLFWGDVGPDASQAGVDGPEGTDEINLTKQAGNYGWPHFVGPNLPYRNTYLNYYFDPAAPTNDSQWNTGPVNLPPAQPSLLSFFHKCYLPGPVYRYDSAVQSTGKLPSEFDGLWFYFDFNSSKIWVAQLDPQGNVTNTPFHWAGGVVNGLGFLDVRLGPDHHLYVLEYGVGCCQGNVATGKLTRYDYTGVVTNQQPVPALTTNVTAGPVPLTVVFSSAGSFDPDGDRVTVEWDFDTDGVIDSTAANPTFTYMTPGDVNAQLRVSDGQGGLGVANLTIHPGNNLPVITILSPPDGGMIDWNHSMDFVVSVTDVEDGTTSDGSISCAQVVVTPSLGHLDHAHNEAAMQSCTGTFPLVHNHDVEGLEDIFWAVNAGYTDSNGVKGFEQARVHPKRKEAEFFDSASSVQILANTDPWGGGLFAVRALQPGSYVVFQGRNLQGIDSVLYRVATGSPGGSIELRTDSPTGTIIASATVSSTGGADQWMDVTTPVTNPGGKHDLYVVFQGRSAGDFVDLNYVEFQGAGVSYDTIPPYLLHVDQMDPNTLSVRFSEPVTAASAQSVANFAVSAGVSVNGAALQVDQRTVYLTTSTLPSMSVLTVTATGVSDMTGLTTSGTEITYVPFIPTQSIVRINTGGPQVSAGGETWQADAYFSGGATYSFTHPVAGTDDDILYQSERAGSCTYNIPVPSSGEYTVKLHFAEMFFGAPGGGPAQSGKRVFSVNVENGEALLSTYDIFSDVGALTAVVHEFPGVSVQDGLLTIDIQTDVDNAKISAIEVLEPGGVVVPPATPSITITSPGRNSQVGDSFPVTFFVENADPHVRLDVDGLQSGHTGNGSAFQLDGLAPGQHSIRVTLLNPDESLTPYFDEITVTVTVAGPAPSVSINAPADGAVVQPPLNVLFATSNWTVAPGSTHVHYFIDGVDQGSHTTLTPLTIPTLTPGVHTVRIELAEADSTLTGVFDEVTVNVAGPPSVAISAPLDGADVTLPFLVNFSLANWVEHVRLDVDGVEEALGHSQDPFLLTSLTPGTHTLRLTLVDDLHVATGFFDEVTVNVLDTGPPNPPAVEIRLNCGGPEVDALGHTWMADTYYSGGSFFDTTAPIAGTTGDVLYQTEHNGNTTYDIPVPGFGEYTVTLHMAEIYWGAPGGGPAGVGLRTFDVDIENGQGTLTGHDPGALVGPVAANVHSFSSITVQDGFLTVQLTSVVDNATVAAIEVVGGLPTPTITISAPVAGAAVEPPFDVTFAVENWSVAAGSTHVHASIDGGLIGPLTSLDPWTVDSLSPGPHTLRLELVDAGHNVTGIFDEVEVIVPTPPPGITISAPAEGASVPSPVTVTYDLVGWPVMMGGLHLHSYVDGAFHDHHFTAEPLELDLDPGLHSVRFELADSFHNETGVFDQVIFNVSGPPPAIEIATPTNGATVAAPLNVVFSVQNWTVANGLTHIHSFVDGVLQGPLYSTAPWHVPALSAGTHVLRLELMNADHTPTGIFDETTVTVIPPVVPQTVIRVNCGGPAVTVAGDLWMNDAFFTGGTIFENPTPIAGTTSDVIYQSERFGNVTYQIPVPDAGVYDVVLHMAEIYHSAPTGGPGGVGSRVFQVDVEGGQGVLVDHDILAAVGTTTAEVHLFQGVQVADGAVTIMLQSTIGDAKISAIEVRSVPVAVFRRGDFTDNGVVDLEDVVALLSFLFVGGTPPSCPDAADVNGDGAYILDDPLFLMNYMFNGGTPPPSPGPTSCGVGSVSGLGGCVTNGCP